MAPAKYEYQSEFAKRYYSQGLAYGEARGEARGRAAMLLKQLRLKFGPLAPAVVERLESASIAELERWAERILNATTLEEMFK